ncbi:primosomal protein N' [Bartonella quintana]|uniref:Replication restart protein PriA n=1 Tax=Bartonella quintana JK 68 TaxID=1134503 RepID=A0ABR4SNF7_BARQI|nr:primosomal protein N' [Bartonella quintana]ETS12828.1 primosomal protein N' [Bartonella quintana BQ2-D70]KEC62132.1 primosomal protein N' [Bartonella quintana JK 31]KEC63910.1 primosomal protein N' [Bartonella quintana JK 63]KEC64995.1 primosomal protein N' [Bartonella quintana JK 68]KEC65113.1 primosomal protein N' [Bartonella quintana JK 56]
MKPNVTQGVTKRKIVSVLVPLPVPHAYSYEVPSSMESKVGSFVRVLVMGREVCGFVVDVGEQLEKVGQSAAPVAPKKLHSLLHVFDCPPLKAEMITFLRFVSQYTMAPFGLVARLVLSVPAALEPEAQMLGLRYCGGVVERLTPARSRVLGLARDGEVWTRAGLAHAAGTSVSVVEGLKSLGVFEEVMVSVPTLVAMPDPNFCPPVLEGAQSEAAQLLREGVLSSQFQVFLLDGVTGSGKTEVYFEAVAQALIGGKQVLILLPEIALTQQFLDRFHERFGASAAEWHSDLPPRRRERVWRQIAEGRVRVVAGARSALFLPFQELGLIVVDEEHDGAYKQEERIFYHARDMAVARGSFEHFPVILSSATPSIESQANVLRGRYQRVHLPSRFKEAALPQLRVVDMRQGGVQKGRFISSALEHALTQTLEKGEQALLFLNRRGYAPLTLCRVCGHRFHCTNCSSWLVEHRAQGQLKCHHCGYHQPFPEVCPECGTLDHLVACGPGVERIAEETQMLFPQARLLILSTDLKGGIRQLRSELEAIAKGDVDIIIGTQLVAKGHHFPGLSLVGVIDADLGLANGDLRASERTFQLLSQVTGRAGRIGLESLGLLQTYQPNHPVIQALLSRQSEDFYTHELAVRQHYHLPPYGRLASLIVSSEKRQAAEHYARALRQVAPREKNVSLMGPAEAQLALVRGRYRFRLLLQGQRSFDMQGFIRAMLASAPKMPSSVRVQIDIDPQSFF